MRGAWTIAMKDLRLLARDRMALFWALGFPLGMALFVGVIAGGGGARGRMNIAVDDRDGSRVSRAFVERLRGSDALTVSKQGASAARDAVRKGKLVAYVKVRPGFGAGSPFDGGDGPATLEVGIDPARKAEAGYLKGLIIEASFAGIEDRFAEPALMRGDVRKQRAALAAGAGDLNPAQRGNLDHFLGDFDRYLGEADAAARVPGAKPTSVAFQPPPIETVSVLPDGAQPASLYEVTFPSGILWGIIGCVATFAIGMASERERGTLARLRVAPLSRAQILGGKGLACFLACCGVMAALLLTGHVLLGVRLANPAALGAAALAIAVCFVGIMMLVSVLGKTERAVAGASWGIMLPLSMIGGGMVPLVFMPRWMLAISNLSPVKWAIYALEGAIWRGFSAAEMAVPCAILVAVGATAFTAGVVLSRSQA
jgi:ABC-2 type transport system permease protein